MPVRLPFRSLLLSPGSLLSRYWPGGFVRPEIDLYAVGPNGDSTRCKGHLDSCSDWVVFDEKVATDLGLSPPFAQVVSVSGIAGAVTADFTMPPDGTVSLFVTDYRYYYFLTAPPVGFWPPSTTPGGRRGVLGVTGFLHYFDVGFHYLLPRPEIELNHDTHFPGHLGQFPTQTSLTDFLRDLKFRP